MWIIYIFIAEHTFTSVAWYINIGHVSLRHFGITKVGICFFCNIALTDNTSGYNYKRKKTFTNIGTSVNCNTFYYEMATIRIWQSFQQSWSFTFVSKHSPKLELHFCDNLQNIHQSWDFTLVTIHKKITKVETSLLSQFTKHSPKLELHFCHNWMSQNIHQSWNFNFVIKDSPKLELNFCNQNYN